MGVDISTWRSRIGLNDRRGMRRLNISIRSAPVWLTLNIGQSRIYISSHHTIYHHRIGDRWEYHQTACHQSHHTLQMLQCLIQSASTPGHVNQQTQQIFNVSYVHSQDFNETLLSKWLILFILKATDINIPSKQPKPSWEQLPRPAIKNESTFLLLTQILLMSCGDIELNPGPTYNPGNPSHNQIYADSARELTKNTVPLKDLKYPEFCCDMKVDFTLKKIDAAYSDQMADLLRMLCAMLNYAGGVITLTTHIACKDKDIDEWIGKLQQKIDLFIPTAVRLHCIDVKTQALEIWLKRSWKFITYKTHYVTKRDNTTIEGDTTMIPEKLTSPITFVSRVTGIDWTQLDYGEPFPEKEDKHLEFKCYESASDANSLRKTLFTGQLHQTKVIKTSFAYTNTKGGGDILIGVAEDNNGVGILKGQKLTSMDEPIVKSDFNRIMTTGDNGELRIWSSPPSGSEWSINFYPLGNCPNNERRVLIHIRMNQVAGGVFADEPEAYTMTPEGDIRHVPYKEWRELISRKIQQPQSFSVGPGPLTQTSDDAQEQCNIDEKLLTKLADDLKRHRVALSGRDTKTASWTNDAEDSKESINMAPGVNMKSSINELSKSELLMPTYPHKWVPDKRILGKWIKNTNQEMADCVDAIEQHYSQETVVIIGSKCSKRLFPEITITEPNDHVFDFVVIHENADIDMWSAAKDRVSVDKCKEYTNSTIRMLRAKILSYVHHHMNIQAIDVAMRAFIWNMEDKCLQYSTPPYISSTIDLQVLQEAMAHCLLKGHSHIWNRLGEEYLTTLTKDQLCGLLHCQYSNVIVYKGPPGSGKSILALNLCDQEAQSCQLSKNQILYICSNRPLADYIKFQQKCEVAVIQNGDDLVPAILVALKNGQLCVIIDDAHLQKCSKPQWLELFEAFHQQDAQTRQPRRLAILLDPEYQNFQSDNTEELFQAVDEYNATDKYGQIDVRPAFPRMIRNSRKIFTFFKTNAEGKGKEKLICCHDFQGDDVSLHYTMDDFFLWAENNPLLLLTKEIIGLYNFEENFTYQPTDITILVDSDGKGEAEDDVEKYISIFCQFYPDANIQRAHQFPVHGVVIDELKAFSGLESRVCILVLTNIEATVHVMENSRYKLFVASRGITKVAFLLHGDSVESTLGKLKFSEAKQWQKLSRTLWTEIPQGVLTADNPDDWIKRNVPHTEAWRIRYEPLIELHQLLGKKKSKEKVNSCLKHYTGNERIQIENNCVLLLINTKDATFQTISKWLKDHVDAQRQDSMRQFWKSKVTLRCHHMIETEGYRAVFYWVKDHILPAWRQDEHFHQVVIAAVCKKTILEEYEHSGFMDLRCYLASLNCLYGAPEACQFKVLDTVYSHVQSLGNPEGLLSELLHRFIFDGYISNQTMQCWISKTDKEDVHLLQVKPDDTEQNLAGWLQERMRDGQNILWVIEQELHMKDWYNLPHYQRVVLSSLCQAAVTWHGEQCYVDRQMIWEYVPRLFHGLGESLQLLYAVQTAVCELQSPPGLAVTLLQSLTMARELKSKGQPLVTVSELKEWRDTKKPLFEMGREVSQELGPFISFMEFSFGRKTRTKIEIQEWILLHLPKEKHTEAFELAAICLINKGTPLAEISTWILQNVPEDKQTEAFAITVICLINRGTGADQIRHWIIQTIPQSPTEAIKETWKMIMFHKFHEMILAKDLYDWNLTDWMSKHLLNVWRQEQSFIQDSMKTIWNKILMIKHDKCHIVVITEVRHFLGALTCFYGTPDTSQYQFLDYMYLQAQTLVNSGEVLHQLLHILLHDEYISAQTAKQWRLTHQSQAEKQTVEGLASKLTNRMKNRHEVMDWMNSTLLIKSWKVLTHYQSVVLSVLSEVAVTWEGDCCTVDIPLIYVYIDDLFYNVSNKSQLLDAVEYAVHMLANPPGLLAALLTVLLCIRRKDTRSSFRKEKEEVFTVADLVDWRDNQEHVSLSGEYIAQELAPTIQLVEYVRRDTPHKEIREWLSIHIPEKSLKTLQESWKMMLSWSCYQKILCTHYEDLPDWMDCHVPSDWRHDQHFLHVMVDAVCTTVVTNYTNHKKQMDLTVLRYYLRSLNCLCDAPENLLHQALSTICNHVKHICNETVFRRLLQEMEEDCLISTYTKEIWYKGLYAGTLGWNRTRWNSEIIPTDKLSLTEETEQDIIEELKNRIRNKEEIGWWRCSELEKGPYSSHNFQRVALSALCQEAVTQQGDIFTVDEHLLWLYIPQLINDEQERLLLLHAVQTIARDFDRTPQLSETIMQNLLAMRDQKGKPLFSADDIQKWKEKDKQMGMDIPRALMGSDGDNAADKPLSGSATEQVLDKTQTVTVSTSDDAPGQESS